jgi:hypothetical protein
VTLTVAPQPPTAQVTLASSVGPVSTFTIACHGIPGQACAETATATTRLRESGSTILGVTARAKPPRHRHRPVTVTATVAQASYSVPAGTSATVPLSLNSVGMRVLSHFLRLPTNVTFTGTSAAALPVTFAYPRVPISVSNQWAWGCTASGQCHTTVQKLSVAGLPAHATVTVLCGGGGCRFGKHVLRPHGAKLAVTSLFAGTNLRPASKVTIEVSAAQRVGYEVVYTVQRNSVPSATTLCLEPGARTPLACT